MDDQYAMRAAAMPYGNGMMGGQYQYGQNGDYATSTAYGNAAAAYYPYPNQGAATNGKDQVMQQYNMSYPLAYHTNMLLPGANGEQTSQSPSQSQQQQASYASYPQGASLPPHYGSMVQQTSASTSTTSSPTATPVKIEKSHSMTPVPSTSSSSNTTSSPAASHPEEEGPSRLAQLASLSADALISQDRQAATPQQ
ncbi:hypothetical protein BC940DRAFT_292469 [Gongronella butleri]|nr:hypothetical protein BC940DRAFT_292469 [Gongronella butleri]